MRQKIAHQVATALRNDTSPIPGVLSERLALKGIDLVAEWRRSLSWMGSGMLGSRAPRRLRKPARRAADHGNRGAAAIKAGAESVGRMRTSVPVASHERFG